MAKYFFLLLAILICNITVKAQLNLSDLKDFQFGTSFSNVQSREKIINLFKEENEEYSLYKGDFLNTYRIVFVHSPFDYYGDADYTFQYVKDSLSDIQIDFDFPEGKSTNFSRFIKQIISDCNSNFQDARKQFKFNKLNVDSITKIVELECKKGTNHSEGEIAAAIWNSKDPNSFDNKLITITMNMVSGQHLFNIYEYGKYHDERYTGSWMNVKITIMDVRTFHLYLLNAHQNSLNYNEIERFSNNKSVTWDQKGYPIVQETTNKIKLTDENGIYKLPVKLNNILTMDFVLDLGASDISITPDVFLVLIKSGTISEQDFIGNDTYQFADGSTAKSDVINLKSITIGDKVLENVRASVSKSINAPLLLGQSAMKKLNNYKIDVDNKLLIIE